MELKEYKRIDQPKSQSEPRYPTLPAQNQQTNTNQNAYQPPNVQTGQPNNQTNYDQPPAFSQPMTFPSQPQVIIGSPYNLMSPSMQNYDHSVLAICPCCKYTINSVVVYDSGNTTILWAIFCGACLGLTCASPFCCIPFLCDSCLDKAHYCPNCGHNILIKHQRCFEFMGF